MLNGDEAYFEHCALCIEVGSYSATGKESD
jgi:hypothetical protein